MSRSDTKVSYCGRVGLASEKLQLKSVGLKHDPIDLVGYL